MSIDEKIAVLQAFLASDEHGLVIDIEGTDASIVLDVSDDKARLYVSGDDDNPDQIGELPL